MIEKRLLGVFLVACGVLLAGVAQAQHAAVTPAHRSEEGWWQERYEAMNARVKEGNVDLLFIGDSITQSWEDVGKPVWEQYYGHRNAVNLGISGDQTQHVIWRLQNGNVDGIAPKAAVIMIGTNNFEANSGQEIGEGIQAVVKELRARLPQTKVLVLAIFPRDETPTESRAKLAEASRIAAASADGDMVHFLDIAPFFTAPDGKIDAAIMPDFLHLTERGYHLWAEAIEPKVAELLGEYSEQGLVGFDALFNGKDLSGWKGLVKDPVERAKMSPEELAAEQAKADEEMRAHWKVQGDALHFDGAGHSLVTGRDYGDVDMLVDWKIEAGGDSGIYLRGAPQVQIWDPAQWPQGSGGLYNNKENPADPLVAADKAIGEWNRFRIRMIGDLVTVYLNDVLVVSNVKMENYWERDKPIYEYGPLELQSHGSNLWFKNIYVRELPRGEGWKKAFNGRDLSGWEVVGGKPESWRAESGVLITEGEGGGWLSTAKEYGDFEIELEYKVPENGNSGLFIRAPREGNPAFEGSEIQILDDYGPEYAALEPWQYSGSVYSTCAPSHRATRPAGEWQKLHVKAQGTKVQVMLNGSQIIDCDLSQHEDKLKEHPGLARSSGYLGLQNHGTRLEFRNIRIREL